MKCISNKKKDYINHNNNDNLNIYKNILKLKKIKKIQNNISNFFKKYKKSNNTELNIIKNNPNNLINNTDNIRAYLNEILTYDRKNENELKLRNLNKKQITNSKIFDNLYIKNKNLNKNLNNIYKNKYRNIELNNVLKKGIETNKENIIDLDIEYLNKRRIIQLNSYKINEIENKIFVSVCILIAFLITIFIIYANINNYINIFNRDNLIAIIFILLMIILILNYMLNNRRDNKADWDLLRFDPDNIKKIKNKDKHKKDCEKERNRCKKRHMKYKKMKKKRKEKKKEIKNIAKNIIKIKSQKKKLENKLENKSSKQKNRHIKTYKHC